MRDYFVRPLLGFPLVLHKHSQLVVRHKTQPSLMLGQVQQLQLNQILLLGLNHLHRIRKKRDKDRRLIV